MDAVERIEIRSARIGLELLIQFNGGKITVEHIPIFPTQHIDMGAHVHQMARIRHQPLQPIRWRKARSG